MITPRSPEHLDAIKLRLYCWGLGVAVFPTPHGLLRISDHLGLLAHLQFTTPSSSE